MPRSLTIVGLGEALLMERPDGAQAAGLAAAVAVRAAELGHVGVVISRVGQDAPGAELTELLDAAGVNTTHLQSDPDLPTGRTIVRATGDVVARHLDARAAFDNLQWDFDLEDVAQQADAVVFSMLTRRSGQTRSEENRFLAACAGAIKILDMTTIDGAPDRRQALAALEIADGAIVHAEAVHAVLPGSDGKPLTDVAADVRRQSELSLLVTVEPAGAKTKVTVHRDDGTWSATVDADRAALTTAQLAIVEGLLRGQPPSEWLSS
ncbi:MAG: PfkB family carbohydrate kinase [Planctomycetota bacterium]|jgi:sugar/nucleoside kinase (ribokinase family)